ncbi:MAG: AP protein [Gemmatimonadetes bacterium]|nr:AP protein [Gemmatimonadota bacterium]
MTAKRQTRNVRWIATLAAGALATAATDPAMAQGDRHVIVITLDGLRWQELFDGADRDLITGADGGVSDSTATLRRFWRTDRDDRRRALMPFLWSAVDRQGLILGDSAAGSVVRVTNGRRFSYPGYNELFVGAPDDRRIDSNRKLPNPNVTVLEWLGRRPGFGGRVEVFGSWDVFPSIFNAERSGLPVNGDGPPFPRAASDTERALNRMSEWLPALWAAARLDAPTMAAAAEALVQRQPRVLTVLLGETDEWAHARRYDQYLDAAHRADRFIEYLWTTAQTLPSYRGRTTLLISTDHGRGNGRAWTDHGEEVPSADRIWMAVLGPEVSPTESLGRQPATQSQFAATIARVVGEDWQTARPDAAGPLRLRPD